MTPLHTVRNERGIALVVALLVLLVLSLLSAALMMSVNTETLIAGHSQRQTQAMNTAEAGLAEAVARIRLGDIPNNMNPAMVAKIFNAPAGSVPVLAAPQIALATAQPAGQWLDYSTATDGADVLTVRYRTDAASNILKYDPTKNPAIQNVSGSPIFVVTATGRDGRDVRRVQEEVISKPFNVNIKAALAAKVGIDFLGNSHTCGFDHRGNTPTGVRDRSVATDPGQCWFWEGGPQTPVPGGYSTGVIDPGGSSNQFGNPSGYVDTQVGFYAGPWEALSMSQAEFFSWVGPPVWPAPNPPRGIYYLNGNTAYHGGDGEGFLYVNGNLTINGTFNFRGVIYVEGNTQINGTFWCLGALIVKGTSTIKHANGNATILYSSEAIQQALQKYGGSMVAISWKEL